MVIQLNGKDHTLTDRATAADLVTSLQLTGKRIAMEVNLEIIPRSSYDSHQLHEGDKIEIVHAIGGGAQ
ncbi:MAG: sulfur carrier protein ThiS [Gammaproteobacteria bacterium]|jgi:sulfur carrier protein|nr:sulfur carrier protein ThiS [Gammaproteobacteria bacterium]MBT4811405.1 sulfur carrier protein ThiS [Thiotrichales bacterium]MBT5361959.1 sulfur carrier protein ThiS [Gammaproteobacteria bacterium]MBT5636632.1 sulfur carrier protein ThiS [Gammaproteobacteria bacterium]MBT5744804.1 sulfur carrier protein ThiS [Gammaproteobacteria bacterium]